MDETNNNIEHPDNEFGVWSEGAADAAIRIFLKSFFKLTKAFKLQIVSVFLTSEGLLREI